jgi:8-oxo-dGTP diphosphatase
MKKGTDYIGVAAGAMIFDEDGKLFLAKRSQKCKNEKGHWETPGGSVKFGERQEAAARREILEEFGAEIDIYEQFPAADHLIPLEKQHWVATTFLAKFKSGQVPKIMEPEKCDEIGWFSLSELPDPLSIITKSDIAQYRKNGSEIEAKLKQNLAE